MSALEVSPGFSRRCSTTFGSRSAAAVASLAPIGAGPSAGAAGAAVGRSRRTRAALARRPAPLISRSAPAPPGATSRSVHCSRSPAVGRPAADEEQRAERVAAVQRAVAAAAGVGHAAPVDRLVAERQGDDEVAGVRRAQRRVDAGERVRVLLAAQDGRPRRTASRTAGSPSRSQRPPRRSPTRRRAGSAAARRPRSTTATSVPLEPADQVDAFGRRRAGGAPRRARRARPRRGAGRRGRRGRSG